MSRPALTRRQAEVLKLVMAHVSEHGSSASLEELASALGVSRPTAHEHLRVLAVKRYVSRAGTGSRPYLPTDMAHQAIPDPGRWPTMRPAERDPSSPLVALCRAWDRASKRERVAFVRARIEGRKEAKPA